MEELYTPLARVQIEPRLPELLQEAQFIRTEQRGVALLLKAIPSQLRATLVATREFTSTAILFRLLVTYQPGGTGEKQLLLKQLSEVNSQSKSTSDQLVS